MLLVLAVVACAPGSTKAPGTSPAPFDTGVVDTSAATDSVAPADTGDSVTVDSAASCPAPELPPAGPVDVNAACVASVTPAADPWQARTLWSLAEHPAFATWDAVFAPPAVGQLNDDNGDGVIDGSDRPDIAVTFAYNTHTSGRESWTCGNDGRLAVLDGATGALEWSWDAVGCYAETIIADVDGDGSPNVVTYDGAAAEVIAFDGDGTVVWRSAPIDEDGFEALSIADLDGDGFPEVMHSRVVLDGRTGALRAVLTGSIPQMSPVALPVDVDGAAPTELVHGLRDFDADGVQLANYTADWPSFAWPVPVQADKDPAPEIAWVGGAYNVVDGDGTVVGNAADLETFPGPPCAADLDGDGKTEVVAAYDSAVHALTLDGSLLWELPIDGQQNSLLGCSVFDVDGDGLPEVLISDRSGFSILDGATGAVRYTLAQPGIGFWTASPVVADLDGDGHADILIVGTGTSGAPALTALTNDGDGWSAAPNHWNTPGWAGTGVTAAGRVPALAQPTLDGRSVFRGQVAGVPAATDLAVTITSACTADCATSGGAVVLQVANHGTVDAPAGVRVRLYAEDETAERLVAEWAVDAIPAGQALAGVEVDVANADLPHAGWRAVIDASRDLDECDETNNDAVSALGVCP